MCNVKRYLGYGKFGSRTTCREDNLPWTTRCGQFAARTIRREDNSPRDFFLI